ncbi:DNA helicase UvrD [bacterium]|nr:DNA helicase UvrD [bacterium]
MDKRVILAVAGSGKTTYLINQLDDKQRTLVVTYTNNNYFNIRNKILKKYGQIPPNIKVFTYYTFLYSFCYRPLLSNKCKARGINFNPPPSLFLKNDARYIDSKRRLYSNRITKYFEEKNVLAEINKRIERYFDNIFVDEIQDFAGHDFNFIENISGTSLKLLFVGDFYQHTYDTGRDGKTNQSLHKDYKKYQSRLRNMGLDVDLTTLNKSYRCSPTVCKFISDKIGIGIESHRNDETNIIFISDQVEAQNILCSKGVVKLFYREHYKHSCYSRNWGDCKGEDHYNDVCVALYKKCFPNYPDKLGELSPSVKNKLYVACSRARNNLFFISEELLKNTRPLY